MKLRHHICAMALLGLLLGAHNGYIALWDTDREAPLRVFPYRIAGLPPQDRALLERGIPIEGQSELHRLLQDYLS